MEQPAEELVEQPVELLVEQPVEQPAQEPAEEPVEDSGLVEKEIPVEMIQPDISSEMTKKLLSELEVKLKEEIKDQEVLAVSKPTSAPTYEAAGKSLVYNCIDKHWACVDIDSYTKCRENYSWNKSQSLPLQCYPFAVLDSSYDCVTVQQEKIDTIGDSSFCGN